MNREAYANFWVDMITRRSIFYYLLMLILLVLCVSGIIVFIKNISRNYWWRWIYIFGGGYVLFDVIAVLLNIEWWRDLLLFMFNINNPLWNIIWGMFILIGILSLCLGVYLMKKLLRQNRNENEMT